MVTRSSSPGANWWEKKFEEIKNILNTPAQSDGKTLQKKNSEWFKKLNDYYSRDSQVQIYIQKLGHLDGVIAENELFEHKSQASVEDLVLEIECYKDWTERSFKALFEMNQQGEDCQKLAECARKAREDLFKICDEVKNYCQWGETESLTTSSKFDPCQSLFLYALKNGQPKRDTCQLFSNLHLDLTEHRLTNLIQSWETAVSDLVKEAELPEPADATTIGKYICFGKSLETLYSRLATNVSLKSNLEL